MPLRDIPVFRSAYFPKKLFSFFSKTLDLQVRCAHPTGNFAPKRPFGTFRCCGRLICRKEYAVLFSTKRSTFSRFAIYEGSQRGRCRLPPLCKGRWIGAAETEGLSLYAGYSSRKDTSCGNLERLPLRGAGRRGGLKGGCGGFGKRGFLRGNPGGRAGKGDGRMAGKDGRRAKAGKREKAGKRGKAGSAAGWQAQKAAGKTEEGE